MKRRIPLFWLNLAHHKARTAIAALGVTLAVTLLFMQLGFLDGVCRTAVLVYDGLDFDLLLTSPDYAMITQAGTFPRRRLYQAAGHEAVVSAAPLYVGRQAWRNPDSGGRRPVVLLGLDPYRPVFRHPELDALRTELSRPDTVLLDQLSRPEIAPRDPGQGAEVGGHRLEVIGRFTLGPGFETGLAAVSEQTFSRLFEGYPLSDVSVGLLKLAPGSRAEDVAAQLRRALPEDVHVLTRADIERKEQWYWVFTTSTGIIFGFGVVVALLFGSVVIYQVLSLEVTSRLSEYATLKAMGYRDRFLSRVVLQQSLFFATVSYTLGFGLAMVIYLVSRSVTKLPLAMTPGRAAGVFMMTYLMCSASGLLALRILRRADPAELFR